MLSVQREKLRSSASSATLFLLHFYVLGMVIENAIKVKNEVWESVAYYAQESSLYAFLAIVISLLLRIIDFSKEILTLRGYRNCSTFRQHLTWIKKK